MLPNASRAAARVVASLGRPSLQRSIELLRVSPTSIANCVNRQSFKNFIYLPGNTISRRNYATDEGTPEAKKPAAKRSATKKSAGTGATEKPTKEKKPSLSKEEKEAAKLAKSSEKKKKTATKTATKPKKKVLTDEQKEAAKAAKAMKNEKAHIKTLKATSLTAPKQLPSTSYTVMQSEMAKEAGRIVGPEASARYKNLAPAELEHYNHLANQNKAANDAAYKAWVESFTPAQINDANNARRALWRAKGSPKFRIRVIHDSRKPKRSLQAYMQFSRERYASGDLKHMSIKDAGRLIGNEWKSLTDAERKRYQDAAEADRIRYEEETKAVMHREVQHSSASAT